LLLVTSVRLVRLVDRVAWRAHYVPINKGRWRVIMGTLGHGWVIAEAFEVAHDVGVVAVDDVLVAKRGRG
jgi:hypothetical protein